MANVHDKLLLFMRVIETDFSFTYLIFFIAIEMTAFHEFMTICSCVLFGVTFAMVFAQMLSETTEKQKNFKKFLVLIFKLANVTLTILAFIQLFISDGSFDIAEDLTAFIEQQNGMPAPEAAL